MLNTHLYILLLTSGVLFAAADQKVRNTTELTSRELTAIINLSNPYDAGEWGAVQICPISTHAHAFELRYNPPDNFDETAVNGVKLYCSNDTNHGDAGYVTSTVSPEGRWWGMRICSDGNFITGFRGQVLQYQGMFTDDVAVENFEVECNYGSEILPGLREQKDFSFDGEWSFWASCPLDSAVCGLQTRVEEPQTMDDDTALTDVQLFCCSVEHIEVTKTTAATTTAL